MKRAVELQEVAKLAGMALFVRCGKVSTDVCARGGCVTGVDKRVTFVVFYVTGNARFAIIAKIFAEISAELSTFFRCI